MSFPNRLAEPRKISEMRDAERYQKELDMILQKTEGKAKRATYLSGVVHIEQLFEVAAQRGISLAESWRIIDQNPDPRSGLLALIESVQQSSK